MMNGPEKSDSVVVAAKPANKAGQPAAEWAEPRTGTKGNTEQPHTRRTQSRDSVSQGLDRVRNAARQRKKEKFTTLLHHVSVDLLRESFLALKRRAAPGVDGVTWEDYELGLEGNLVDLHARVHSGGYRALPVRRRFIPKPGTDKQRPLGIAALEDKIVQRSLVAVLNAIYEEDFLGFSYGFRPGRNQHDALDALSVAISDTPVNWILDADIRSFFDSVSQEWLLRFLGHRIGDERVVRLVRKWLKAGVLDDGEWSVSAEGTPQGAVISPLLANVYLHYVFDLWAKQWRGREAGGNVIVVRYADDIVVGFEHEADARRFWDAMRTRFEQFGLELHGEKTRLLEFGRHAAGRRQRRGLGKPETFTFLGFIFICGRSRRGAFLLHRKTRVDRMRARLQEIKRTLRKRMHATIPQQGKWLKSVVTGYSAYHAVPTNIRALRRFRYHVMCLWLRTLRRRSQKDKMTWARLSEIAGDWLPTPRILHPWPSERFAVKHPR
ncbi:group II intron reverse transcriptase/maturase [Acidithiobacillus ferrooxidans]|uniref:group II intron reverse transcriptase/maturase n=1 Tax=Acidithiobacillus ferrooxidans TaxID=920 RepID=UPI0002187ABA|nr:group II intron reverse transcriptase/maturase [Acidithiobacillus ferrooxidans]EGQ63026.1 reverse transcriptase [Acidithiobacillus sp. GGI-221]MCL4525323.1 group II intron reverse transcriptase/maturase [Gammaproteobacteria bacterium]MCR0969996.1 group II intron reverse transcriptase/maturase [Acidithiobacillus ferrooxidans]MCR1341759.1 group II intron reverse transcriptase/maturase [Acidithiobacillus ferrooxidans]MCR1349212.1 group II intron reverse transcriptase/maturase [Acidithiobacillu